MEPIGFFAELGYADGPSLMVAIGMCPESRRDEIADYLDGGSALVVASSWVDDVIDPSATRVARSAVYTDGHFVWPHALGYYVRRYGVDVPIGLADRAVGHRLPRRLSDDELVAMLEKQAAGDGIGSVDE